MTRFLIIGTPRSGTTVTKMAMHGHPHIGMLNDEIKPAPFFTKGISTFTYGNDAPEEKEIGHLALFDTLTSLRASDEVIALGMKTAVAHFQDAIDIRKALVRHFPGLHLIHVIRTDLAAQYGSLLRAQSTGQWHSWREAKPNQVPFQGMIDTQAFFSYSKKVFSIRHQLKQLKHTHPYFEFSYEEDVVSGRFQKLFEFIGVKPVEPTWLKSRKVAPPPAEYITNYETLCKLAMKWQLEFEEAPENFFPSATRAQSGEQAARSIGLRRKLSRILKIIRS